MTVAIVAFEKFAQHQPVDEVWFAKRVAVFIAAGVFWGFATRRAILWRRQNAR